MLWFTAHVPTCAMQGFTTECGTLGFPLTAAANLREGDIIYLPIAQFNCVYCHPQLLASVLA